MGLKDIGNLFRRSRDKPETRSQIVLTSSDWYETIIADGYTPLSRNEIILRCVHKIADLVSDMTIMLMENGENGDIRIKNELSRVVDITPNTGITRKPFIYKLVSDMMLYGNAYAVPEYDGMYLTGLRMLPAQDATADKMPGQKEYVVYTGGTRYKSDELLHFILVPDDQKPFRGVGFAPQILGSVRNLVQANETKTAFLKSKWKPSIVISIDSDVAELQDPEKRKKILGSYAAETERGEPWLIPAGQLDIKTIQPLTLNDLAIQDSITLDMRAIATAVGIPPFLVGVGDFNRDAYNNFVATTIMSFATIIQQEMTRKLLYSEKWYFKFNPKSLMQYSLSEKSTFVTNMTNSGMLSRNEGRAAFDYSPADAPGMNDYIVLENYIKIGDVDKQKKLMQQE